LGSVLFVYVAMGAATPRITMLANASSKLLLACKQQKVFSGRNREVFSLGSVPRTRCNRKIVLLVNPKLQEGEVGR
jgi:hypothetical protein